MGICFSTNTWRAPLQLIDCWLPIKPAQGPAAALALPQTLQKFVRAGWLNRASEPSCSSQAVGNVSRPCATVHNLDVHRRGLAQPPQSRHQSDARLLLSGRMGEVCAELERLAAIEIRAPQ